MKPSLKAGNRAFYSTSFLIFIARFFPSLASLLVVVIYSRNLPKADYGSYQNFWIQLNVLCPVACFGIHALLVTYSPAFIVSLKNRIPAGGYLKYVFWVLLLGGVFSWLQGRGGTGYIIPFVLFVFYSFSVILESAMVVFRRFGSLIALNLLYALCYGMLHYYVLRNGFSLYHIFLLLTVVVFIRFAVYGIIVLRSTATVPADDAGFVDNNKIKNLWLHLGFYDVSQSLFSYVDKFIISLALASGVSAVYFNGAQNIPFLPILLSSAASALLLQLSSDAGGYNAKDATIALLLHSGKVLSCIVFPIFFFLFLSGGELMGLLHYPDSTPVFLISVCVLPLRAYSFTTVLQKHHKGATINIGAVLDLALACALFYPFYRWLGLPGVALSFVVSTYFQAAFYLFHSARALQAGVFEIIPLKHWLLQLIVFGSLFIGIHYVAKLYFTGHIVLFLTGAVMIALIGGSLWYELRSQKQPS